MYSSCLQFYKFPSEETVSLQCDQLIATFTDFPSASSKLKKITFVHLIIAKWHIMFCCLKGILKMICI